MKIFHLADIHANDRNISEISDVLFFIAAQASKERPDLIVVAGDTVDSQSVKLDSEATKTIFRHFKNLADLAPMLVIIGTASHDGHAAEVLEFINARYPVKVVSRQPEQIFLHNRKFIKPDELRMVIGGIPVSTGEQVLISAVPAPTKQFFKSDSDIRGADNEIAQAMTALFGGFAATAADIPAPHILVGHWNVTGSLVSETQTLTGVDIEISKDQMALAQAYLVCLGHIHKAQKIGKNIFFPGSLIANTWGELDTKGFYIHTIVKWAEPGYEPEMQSRFIETPSQKRVLIRRDLTRPDADFENILIIQFCQTTPDPDATHMIEIPEESFVRVELKVYSDDVERIDNETIAGTLHDCGASKVEINLIRIPRENVRSKRIITLERLRDKLIERAALTKETVPQSILEKADFIEGTDSERIIEQVANGYHQSDSPNRRKTHEHTISKTTGLHRH